MSRRAFTPEQIINKLREAEVPLSQGETVLEASRKIGITEQTYYRWRKEYGGMRVGQARRLKELEKENARLNISPYCLAGAVVGRDKYMFHIVGIRD